MMMKQQDVGALNPALTQQAVSFGPVLPYFQGETLVPQGLRYDKDGAPLLTVYAPGAAAVKAEMDRHTGENALPLQSLENGLWSARLEAGPGFHYLQLWADGVTLLSPLLPIGYGYSRPYNYLDIAPLADFCALRPVRHGAVTHEYYESKVTGTMETCLVYTPPGYEDGARYPVLYLQHGHGENETGWIWQGKLNFILDNLLSQGKATPMIVVMNDGMVRPKALTAGDAVDHTLFERRLLGDVMPFIEEKYRVVADREHRALAGLSMGSMQTSIIGFKHTELFGWLGLFSGFMRNLFEPRDDAHLRALLENREAFHRDVRLFFRCMGRDDHFYPHFEEDDRFCEENNIRCVRRLYDGGHDWNVWRSCALDFLQLLFQ